MGCDQARPSSPQWPFSCGTWRGYTQSPHLSSPPLPWGGLPPTRSGLQGSQPSLAQRSSVGERPSPPLVPAFHLGTEQRPWAPASPPWAGAHVGSAVLARCPLVQAWRTHHSTYQRAGGCAPTLAPVGLRPPAMFLSTPPSTGTGRGPCALVPPDHSHAVGRLNGKHTTRFVFSALSLSLTDTLQGPGVEGSVGWKGGWCPARRASQGSGCSEGCRFLFYSDF